MDTFGLKGLGYVLMPSCFPARALNIPRGVASDTWTVKTALTAFHESAALTPVYTKTAFLPSALVHLFEKFP